MKRNLLNFNNLIYYFFRFLEHISFLYIVSTFGGLFQLPIATLLAKGIFADHFELCYLEYYGLKRFRYVVHVLHLTSSIIVSNLFRKYLLKINLLE